MKERFDDIDHCGEFVYLRSPSTVGCGATRVNENLKNAFLITTYFAVGTQPIQFLFEAICGVYPQ